MVINVVVESETMKNLCAVAVDRVAAESAE